jgi:oxalate/formate antiporter
MALGGGGAGSAVAGRSVDVQGDRRPNEAVSVVVEAPRRITIRPTTRRTAEGRRQREPASGSQREGRGHWSLGAREAVFCHQWHEICVSVPGLPHTERPTMATTLTSAGAPAPALGLRNQWLQLLFGVICMAAISSPQYVWTLFTKPLTAKYGVALSALQITFSLLIVLQTFFSPFQGSLVDRFGPRRLITIGALLSGLSWVCAAEASSLGALYLTYGLIGGLGTGIVYVGVVGHMVRWFPRRRGFAVGMVAAGYGMGAILTTFPISSSLAASGLEPTLIVFGLIFAAVGALSAQALRRPDLPAPGAAASVAAGRGVDWKPSEVVRQPLFWLLFVMMSMMSTSGLMVTSQMASFAREFGVADMLVLGLAALPLALTVDRFTNGLTRPFFGWVSDRWGRENTMFIAFALEAAAMALWLAFRDQPAVFVLMSGVVFFGWGEIFSLFPSTLTDTFGTRHATANYGCLYMAQGVGAIFGGPLAALMHEKLGSWVPVFATAITLDIVTALLAIAVLKPWRRRFLGRSA